MQQQLILASGSERRQTILGWYLKDFCIMPALVDELTLLSGMGDISPTKKVERLARAKADEVYQQKSDHIVLGADTVVELDGQIIGKPQDEHNAVEMLSGLSGRVHRVITSIALRGPAIDIAESVETLVFFKKLSSDVISEYVATGDPLDKAGSYGIQSLGGHLVEKYEGCYLNVVGMPLCALQRVLREAGYDAGSILPGTCLDNTNRKCSYWDRWL